ncbi:hypothetical protein [Enterococcus mundtii]|uniref:hypothetical protein n=1 Tax=Enterococcus mundtii TaxID=53346 RepID=UPI001CF36586|nr:hypothetical protein [Enterococcus mundtii]MCA6774789.1 hypothetical protein [Enterococcus mundtii]
MQDKLNRIKEIIKSDIPASQIEANTGITRQNINKYRRGESDIQKMSVENASKLLAYYKVLQSQSYFPTGTLDRLDSTLAFDSLPEEIRILLITREVDKRAATEELNGFHLRYNLDQGFLYSQVHSGAGSGHPVFEFVATTAFIVPSRSYVSECAGTIIKQVKLCDPISKWFLYEKYLNDKDNILSSISKIGRMSNLDKNYFDIQYNRIEK